MHISLDSALGQQRRLNSVGESITQIAPDPAAAYSLRSLTGGDPKVVRVRRESDNTERDFTASGVSSGALVDFVNSQTVKPLDTRALNSGGSGDRDGDFQIASAAYSLRSLGDRQATVAATGDTVTAANGKYVVQVRRSKDDTIKSFTADEVSDGTLVSFVTEEQTQWTTEPSWSITGGSEGNLIRSQSNTASTSTITFFAYGIDGTISDSSNPSHIIASAGDTITVNITATNLSKASTLQLRQAGGTTSVGTATINNGTANHTISVSGDVGHFAFIDVSTTDDGGTFPDGTITFNSISVIGQNGFVRTWYDQSVTDQGGGTATGNHAVQATAANQPKIVSSGSLVSNGIDFDGTNDFLPIPLTGHNIGNLSSFCVGKFDSASGNSDVMLSLGTASGNSRWYAPFGSSSSIRYGYGSASNAIAEFSASTDVKIHTIIAGTTIGNASGFENGTLKGTATRVTTTSAGTIGIGGIDAVTDFPLNGKVQEVIVYESDQSANRGAYEGNIADHYNISGVPTEDNTVNGFVETWYDQSGNGNDVTQTTSTKQPKIVNSGSLVTVNSKASFKFDGANDFLNKATHTQGALSQPNTAFAVAKLDANDDQNRKVFDGDVATARHMLQLNTTGNGQFAHFAGTVATTGEDADANRHLFTCLFNGSSSRLRIDSTQKSTSTTGSNAMNGIVIGANHDTVQNFWDGDIQEVIFFSSDQTSNFTALETNINSHYSIF